jgi:surface antigen
MKNLIAIGAIALSLTACMGSNNGSTLGGLGGSAIGTKVGYGLGGAATGALVGMNVFNMFKTKRNHTDLAFQQAAEHGQRGETRSWYDPSTFNSGSFTVDSTIQRADGKYCRQLFETVKIHNKIYSNIISACRNNKTARWEIN